MLKRGTNRVPPFYLMPEPGTNHVDPLIPEIGSSLAGPKNSHVPLGIQVVRIGSIWGRTGRGKTDLSPFCLGTLFCTYISRASKFRDLAPAVIGRAATDYPRPNHEHLSRISSIRIELIELLAPSPLEINIFEWARERPPQEWARERPPQEWASEWN